MTLLTSALVFPISPHAFAAAIEAKSADCILFYENNIEKPYVLPLIKKVKIFNFPSAHETILTVIDLAQVQPKSVVDRMVKSYFQFVRSIYQERLKKFSSQMSPTALSQQAFIDKNLADRSLLIVDTPNEQPAADGAVFNGGVRVTVASYSSEKLPLQYELPDNRRHNTS